MLLVIEFQSPQWGDNSKDLCELLMEEKEMFQSPQWGDNSKGYIDLFLSTCNTGFSPRNGEIILKGAP